MEEHQQGHILAHYETLDTKEKVAFLENISSLNLSLVFTLYKKEIEKKKPHSLSIPSLEPGPVITFFETKEELERRRILQEEGESFLRDNRLAILIVAGGQGARLGFDGPKGAYPITPVRKKPLFQLFAETVLALSRRYRSEIPLLIMTSPENDLAVKNFFQKNGFFGLSCDKVFFFQQEMLPTISPNGNLLLKDRLHLFVNPDGHGGALKAIYRSGLLSELISKGFTDLFYCQVDNPLAKIADPVFLGYHLQEKSEFSLKVVRRRKEEKIGLYLCVDGKPTVIEYSDLPLWQMGCSGKRVEWNHFWAGSIAIHIISLSFIERLNKSGFQLPYHRAVKTVNVLKKGEAKGETTAWKFETFVFDALPAAKKSCCIEVLRKEEFAPVKNRVGEDSPETAKAAMVARFTRWLSAAGVNVSPGVQVEISPLFALDEEELKCKVVKAGLKTIEADLYLANS